MSLILIQFVTICTKMKTKSYKSVIAISLMILLTGCSSARDIVGLSKQSPNEFEVVTRAPLSLPPDYGLRVPVPKFSRTQEKSLRESADKLIPARGSQSTGQNFSRADRSGAISPAEEAILGRAQAKISDQSIRAEINSDNKTISGTDKKLIEKIMFWQGTNKSGAVLDPEKESERIKGLKSDGKPISNRAVPVMERADRGLLDGLF
ncbi:MAG: DUF3035 domain-containing protein [Pseudomonadota bacterium]|nr:DUF3035 domain-containing protein [Pseudomonadota bacterium]